MFNVVNPPSSLFKLFHFPFDLTKKEKKPSTTPWEKLTSRGQLPSTEFCNLKMDYFLPESSAATQKLKLGRMNCWYRSDSSCAGAYIYKSIRKEKRSKALVAPVTHFISEVTHQPLLPDQVYRSRRKGALAKKIYLAGVWCLCKVKQWLLQIKP